MNEMELAVDVQGLTKKYGSHFAVKDLHFQIKTHEIVGFLGPNGAGKSTTMRIISGLSYATSGRVFVCGRSVASEAHLTKNLIGYMPENNPLPEELRVKEYLDFRATIKGLSGKKKSRRVQEVMEMCELHHKAKNKIIATLSKGFRQRVGVADAILAEPKVVIMDEPTIGLDPHQILTFRRMLENVRGSTSVILSSHILDEVEKSCDRVVIINQGQLVASGNHASLEETFLPNERYRLVIKGNFDALEEALAQIHPSLQQCERRQPCSNAYCEVFLESERGTDLCEQIVQYFTTHAEWSLRELNLWQPTLEEIFLAATRQTWKEDSLAESRGSWKNKSVSLCQAEEEQLS